MSIFGNRSAMTAVVAASACLVCAAAAAAADPAPDRGVLVLRSGKLVRGRITHSAAGFEVDVTNGRMMVPYSLVRFQAASEADAYRRLRDAVERPSPNYRMALAQWCITNGLYEYALKELDAVLKANPEHNAARRMRTRIEAMLSPDTDKPKKKLSIFERLAAPDVTALAGLSPDVSRQFVSRVQPILVNGCALAGCHGPRSKNGFQLMRVHLTAGSRRGSSERNLAATLRYVDLRNSARSPLLTRPLGRHGRRGKPVFRGRAGAKQLAELRNWVRRVVDDSFKDDPGRAPARSRVTDDAARAAASGGSRAGGSRAGFGVRSPLPSYQATPAMKAARSRIRNRRVRDPIRPATRSSTPSGDPFDPAEFNRRTAPSTGPPNSSSRFPGQFR